MRSRLARTLAVLGLSTVVLTLAACGGDQPTTDPSASASPEASASATPSSTVPVSSSLDKIKVTGDFGKSAKVTFDAPFAIDETRSSDVIAGKGVTVEASSPVEVHYAGYNGRTGKEFDQSFDSGQSAVLTLDEVVPGFGKGLAGHKVGSRVLIAMPGTDGYDGSGGNPQIEVEVGDTLIFVVDILSAPLKGPEGTPVTPPSGLPTVTDDKGTPKITIPDSEPPKELVVQPLIKGDGAKVTENDTLTFDYLWVSWTDGRVIEQTYDSEPATYELAGLIPGMAKGLVGQTVGSRVLLIVPPADGYPDGNADPKIDKGETLVLVVDILFAQPAG